MQQSRSHMASDYSVMLSKFSVLRRISRISFIIGSQTCVQNPVASRHPSKSPKSHAQQFSKLPHFPQKACCMANPTVTAGLMTSPASGAKERAMWQKMAMLMQPESSLSMKVVFGFERTSVKRTKMKMPMVSLETTLKMSAPPPNSRGYSRLCPRTSHQKRAESAARNCARKQKGSTRPLYLLSFLRKLARVMVGFTFAPHSKPEKKMAISKVPAACASISLTEMEHQYPQVKMKTAANSKPKSCLDGAMFMMLNSSWSNLLRVLSFRVLESLSYYQSWDQRRVRFISSFEDIVVRIIDQVGTLSEGNIWGQREGM